MIVSPRPDLLGVAMLPLRVNRRLTCILAADAVGYSAMMSEDEAGTIRILAAHRAVIDGIIAFHEGRIIGTAGDSVLAEFSSPVEAVRCATEIQEALKTRNESLQEDHRLYFRIGVNLGDVVVKDDDLLGDGVNVAARLESIAEPGGICIASSVYDQITGKLDLGFVDIGEQNLKNLSRPIHVYRVAGTVTPIRSVTVGRVSWRKPIALALAGAAAVVILVAVAMYGPWAGEESSSPVRERAQAAIETEKREAATAATEAKLRAQSAAELLRTRAEADAATVRARAQAEAATVRAKMDADAANERAQSEIEKLRSRADADRAKSEGARRGAEAKVAAIGARAAATEQSAQAAKAPSSSKALPAGASYDGNWVATFACAAFKQIPAGTFMSRVTVRGDEFVVEPGVRGQPGYWHVSGRPASDGSLVLTGMFMSRTSAPLATEGQARFNGRLVGDRFVLDGRFGPRGCSLTMARAGR